MEMYFGLDDYKTVAAELIRQRVSFQMESLIYGSSYGDCPPEGHEPDDVMTYHFMTFGKDEHGFTMDFFSYEERERFVERLKKDMMNASCEKLSVLEYTDDHILHGYMLKVYRGTLYNTVE